MEKNITLTCLILLTLNFCSVFSNMSCQTHKGNQQYIDTLVIEGDNIWIRAEPVTGEVVFTLNEGDVCYVLEKGQEHTIRGNRDFWYKIEFEGQTGWVFGSQTSIRHNPAEGFSDFIYRFASTFIILDEKAENMQEFISTIRGLDFVLVSEKIQHYSRGSDLSEAFWGMVNTDIDISDLDYDENNIELKEMIKKGKVDMTFYQDDDPIFTLTFNSIEGKWFLTLIREHESLKGKPHSWTSNDFRKYLEFFLKTFYSGQNIDSLINKAAPVTTGYIHREIGFYRFYNPGVACVPVDYQYYEGYYGVKAPVLKNIRYFQDQQPDDGFCEEATSEDGIYYESKDALPGYYDMGMGEYSELDIPSQYKDAPVILVKILFNKWIIKTMYFIYADDNWWLVIINTCDCSA